MGLRQKANRKKKLAAKRAAHAAVAQMGDTVEVPKAEVLPQLPNSKESRQKNRRWSYYALLTMNRYIGTDGKPVETEESAAKDEQGNAIRKPLVHKLGLSLLTIGTFADAQKQCVHIREDLKEEHKDAMGIEVFPTGHETVSPTVTNQLSGLKQQNDMVIVALELMSEAYAAGDTPPAIDPVALKSEFINRAFKKIYNIKDTPPETALVNADGSPMEKPASQDATVEVTSPSMAAETKPEGAV